MLAAVVNPLHYGQHRVEQYLVVHAMLAVKADGIAVVLREQVARMHHGIFVAKESVNPVAALLLGYAGKAFGGNLLILLHESLGYDKLLNAVLTGIKKGVLAQHAVLKHCVAHLKGRIYQYAVVSVEHLGIHSAHGRTDDEVGIFSVTDVMKKVHGLGWMQRQVGSHYGGAGQHLANLDDSARLSR